MSWRQYSSVPWQNSFSTSTTPFPGNQFGLASGSSSDQSNTAGTSYSPQTQDNRSSLTGVNLSGDDPRYGTVNDCWNVSTSGRASMQYSTPQLDPPQTACYSQTRREPATLQHGKISAVAPASVSLHSDTSDFGSASQSRHFSQVGAQDFSSAATDTGLSLSGWNHSTFYNEHQQHGYLGHGHSDATSRQSDRRHNTSWRSPGSLPGQRSFNTTLYQPGSSPMGACLSDDVQGRPDTTQRTLATANFDRGMSWCPRIDDANDFSQPSSMYPSPHLLQHNTKKSNTSERNQSWTISSPHTNVSYDLESFAGTTEEDVRENNTLHAASSGLHPWVSPAPPVSTYVPQQDFSSFDTNSYGSLSGIPLTRSLSAGHGVSHSGRERQDVERVATVSSFESSELGNFHETSYQDLGNRVCNANVPVSNPESVASPCEKRDVMNYNSSCFGATYVRRDFSPGCTTRSSQSRDFLRTRAGGPAHAYPQYQYPTGNPRYLESHPGSSGEPYSCSDCGRKFYSLRGRERHQRFHSEVRRYVCPICGRAYTQSGHLSRHKKRIHNR